MEIENPKKRRKYRLYDYLPAWEYALNREIYVFGYYALRMSFTEAFARALNLRNGRLVYEIARVSNTTKQCQCFRFRSWNKCLLLNCKYATEEYPSMCKCENKSSYVLVIKRGYKFYGIYLCEHHMKLLVSSARILMNTAVNSIFVNMYKELFDEELEIKDDRDRILSYTESLRDLGEGEKQ